MLRSFQSEFGHLASDHPRVSPGFTFWQPIAGNVTQQPLVQRPPLRHSHHLKLGNGITDEAQGALVKLRQSGSRPTSRSASCIT